jgi:superfamily I DNA/RNA helicase
MSLKLTAVYGPPGTGKTTWMMNKVRELLESGYQASDIMYLSFTKAAAAEVLRRMGVKTSNTVSTIHSACYRMLNLTGSSIVNYGRLMHFGKQIGVPFSGKTDDANETMEVGDQFLALYSLARNKMTDPEEEYDNSDRPGSWGEFLYFFESYDSWRESNGLIDFTDMLERYHKRPIEHGCKVVFVDEFQDLSMLQRKVVEDMLAQDGVVLAFIAGDDDQAIFEWAGADPHGMAVMEENYDSERIVLGQSYRVPSSVHEIVANIGSRISTRVQKEYKPRDEEGSVEFDEAFEAVNQKTGFILCRSHSIKQQVERELIQRRVPYLSEGGGLPGPFGCKAAKAIRAWKTYKDTGVLSVAAMDAMLAGANERVRADLLAGDKSSILEEDPFKIFRIPAMFMDYFEDVDIHTQPELTVMTIHSSKGREADNVTLIQNWPRRVQAGFALNPDQEHRVWYVAASRARHNLRVANIQGPTYNVF